MIVPYSSGRKNKGQSKWKCRLAKRINSSSRSTPADGKVWFNSPQLAAGSRVWSLLRDLVQFKKVTER